MKYAIRLFAFLTILAAGFIFFAPQAHAATLNVVAGTDSIDANGQCQLSEAIQNINDQAATNADCGAGDSNNDTINIPAGTVTLSDHLKDISQPVTIQGQGMGETVIDGLQQYRGFNGDGGLVSQITIKDLTIRDYREAAIAIANANVVLSGIEINGSPTVEDQVYGIYLINDLDEQTLTADLSDITIHDLTLDASSIAHIISINNSEANTTYDVEITNVTVANIDNISGSINTVILGNGFFGNANNSQFSSNIRNLTLENIVAQGSANGLVGGSAIIDGAEGDALASYDVANITVKGIRSQTSMYGTGSSLVVSTIAVPAGTVATASMQIANSLFADNILTTGLIGCQAVDYGPYFGSPEGESNPSITSLGGNISDDASCNSVFSNPADQTEVSGLASTLGPLLDSGGSVSTIPLLPGSPAIDSGVTVPGLTTDARGVARPQCAAYDSGAHEYNGTCPAPQQLTYPDPEKGSTVSLILPSDVTGPTVSAVDPDTIPKDGENQFPAGLTSFQFTTDPGATKTVTLYYDLPGSPSSYTARKYKTNSQSFIDVPGATITREDYNGKSMLKLTYSIADGGILDQDGLANGTVIDPVGLATTNLADTGENTWVYLMGVMTLIGAGVALHRRFAR